MVPRLKQIKGMLLSHSAAALQAAASLIRLHAMLRLYLQESALKDDKETFIWVTFYLR